MRKTGYYSANDFDFLEEGEKLRLEHDLRFQPNDKILLPLVNASDFDLYELRALAIFGEKKVFEQLKELAEVWEQKGVCRAACLSSRPQRVIRQHSQL